MAEIIIHQDKISDLQAAMKLCPFNAIELNSGRLSINAACKMCKICIKKGPSGAFVLQESKDAENINTADWKGITVYVEHEEGVIHPVTLELLGKASELAKKKNEPVYCLFIGSGIKKAAEKLLSFGLDEVFVYDDHSLEHFRVEPYTEAFSDFIEKRKPAIVLVGGTTVGRSLAPRVAARFRTGLTADCTSLEIQEDGGLAQIRPAFGGNIMAHIMTPKRRPQFATVRYKIFSQPAESRKAGAKITEMSIDKSKLKSQIEVLSVQPKKNEKGIEEAEVIIAAGRGIKKPEDLDMIKELASLLNAELAGTRSMIEAGWIEPKRQIGLSGRTVKPKLLITCGISGAIQFVAGMKSSELIMAINTDKDAPIFKNAHYCLVGDIYEIVPALIEKIKAEGPSSILSTAK